MPMERTASVEDMVGNLWRLGRTPSQAEFEQFFSNIAQVGSQQNLAAVAAQAQAAGATNGGAGAPAADGGPAAGIPRVASIDLLRKMIMNQPGMPAGVSPGATIPGMMPGMPAQGVAGFNPEMLAAGAAAGAFGAFAAPGAATLPIAPTAVHAGGMPGANGAVGPGDGGATLVVASLAGLSPSPVPTTAAAAEKPAKPSAKKPAAKKQKTAKSATPPAEKKAGKAAGGGGGGGASSENGKSADDKSNFDSQDDLSDDDDGDGKGGKTTDEIRRQRRMLSNRESARRSRRRKLEHVSTLEGQIAMHKAETAAVLERLHATEARLETVLRENAGLKVEMERLQVQLRSDGLAGAAAGGGGGGAKMGVVGVGAMERSSSLQRIASAGNLVKSSLGGDGGASPQIGGDDSPRGFVPFRSLQSYENLLSLQAQGSR